MKSEFTLLYEQVLELKELVSQLLHQDILPYEDAMEYLQCSRATLDRMRTDGTLKVYQIPGKRRLYVKKHELTLMLKDVTSQPDLSDPLHQ